MLLQQQLSLFPHAFSLGTDLLCEPPYPFVPLSVCKMVTAGSYGPESTRTTQTDMLYLASLAEMTRLPWDVVLDLKFHFFLCPCSYRTCDRSSSRKQELLLWLTVSGHSWSGRNAWQLNTGSCVPCIHIRKQKGILLCKQSRFLTQGRVPLTFKGDLPASLTYSKHTHTHTPHAYTHMHTHKTHILTCTFTNTRTCVHTHAHMHTLTSIHTHRARGLFSQ